MSLQFGALDLILREHKRAPMTGRALTLGRQATNVPYAYVLKLFETHGIEPRPHIPVPEPRNESDPIDADLFFEMMGLSTTILDFSDAVGADIVADLNDPLPERYHNLFGLVLDGGTLEHVFDLRQAFINVANVAAVGGRVIHFNPVNNHVNHGFVQFSPTLFFDYYEANGFTDLSAMMIMYSAKNVGVEPWTNFEYDPSIFWGVNSMFCEADTMLSMCFKATKTATSSVNVRPTQFYFRQSFYDQLKTTPAFRLHYNKPGASVVQQIH